MKAGKLIGVVMAVALMLAIGTGCGSTAPSGTAAAEPETVSEGVDTAITVSYDGEAAPSEGYFLAEGDVVAVITPSALPTQEQVKATVEGLKDWGYAPIEGKHVYAEERTLDDCVEDLAWALEDPEVRAIFCVRGGYGASEVLDQVELDLIKQAAKPVIGYSDISVLHSAWTSAGLPSVHASMSAAFADDFPQDCLESEQRMLRGELPTYKCAGSEYNRQGHAEGVLIGGNLSTFTSVLGTAYDCTKVDQPFILFLEDVGEDVQHVHRYLAVLKHLGVLDRASGVVFGEWTDVPTDMDDYDGASRGGEFSSMADMISRQYAADLNAPVAFGFPAGHGDVNYPLLMGSKATLDVSGDGYALSWE